MHNTLQQNSNPIIWLATPYIYTIIVPAGHSLHGRLVLQYAESSAKYEDYYYSKKLLEGGIEDKGLVTTLLKCFV